MAGKIRFAGFFDKFSFLFFLILPLLFACCKNNDSETEIQYSESRVAVILPLNSPDGERYKRTIEWCLANYRSVRDKASVNIELKIDWYDEAAYTQKDLTKLAQTLASDKDLCAIIGPLDASNVTTVANVCRKTEKPLILPTFSSDDYLRRYSVSATGSVTRPFLWALTENDVSQCEVALSKLNGIGFKEVSVLASADPYGDTFHNWASFISTELKMNLEDNIRYKFDGYSALRDTVSDSPMSKDAAFEAALSGVAAVVLCAMHDSDDMELLLQMRQEKLSSGGFAPMLFFTDSVFTAETIAKGDSVEGLEGTAAYIDPTNGFISVYREHFGDYPIRAEAQIYDSVLFALYGIIYKSEHPEGFEEIKKLSNDENRSNNIVMNDVFKRIGVSSNENLLNNSWSKIGMLYMLREYSSSFGYVPKIEGSCGNIEFDSETFTTLLYSTYIHWSIIDNKVVVLDYLSSEGGKRTSSTRSVWAWNQTVDEFLDGDTDEGQSRIEYNDIEDRYAILIAASSGWKNYRHQADVLNMYRFLSSNGFDDEHIIMVLQDDIAYNSENKSDTGNIRVSPFGDNLYTEKAKKGIDAHPSELNPMDIQAILLGDGEALKQAHLDFSDEKLSRLVYAAPQNEESLNLFLFWSGHGQVGSDGNNSGQLQMADPVDWESGGVRESGFTTELLLETLEKMQAQKKIRKFFIVNESCYSKSVFKAAEGFKGVLVLGAANEIETSFTDVRNSELGVWMTNRFTRSFMHCIESHFSENHYEDFAVKDINISYYDLYATVAKQTLGSHVCLINSGYFGSVKSDYTTPGEFLIYNSIVY
ncbi:C13 family peptidase [uncultured Treponema sp.]|uniref:C13 family peptidase n=1 Tax=uncultured Treponema sp. TaxID=162155 RepID=UPI0025D295DB|nr:C13 family peptidase [uncultured Treponema sp.]